MSQDRSVMILSAQRTPMGGFQGDLAPATAPELGAVAVAAAVRNAGVRADMIDEVIMGCVLPAGLGQAPARQASLGAGLPQSVPATTVNKMCGSGMRAVMNGFDALKAGSASIVVAGGMESMSNAPYLLPKARAGYRMGHQQVMDHMFLDGLEDAYDRGRLMGTFAEDTAQVYQFSRAEQDAFAIRSLTRAQAAIASGAFASEVAEVTVKGRKGSVLISIDEQPGKADASKIPTLKPAFRSDGTVTAANSSSISDGAAALVLASAEAVEAGGNRVIARIVGTASHARAPAWFTTAPVGAIETLLGKIGWTVKDVDLWEINEAFAVVAMCAIKDLSLDPERVNINGGACALGHPIGASGARILVTLLGALERQGLKRGVASLCIGGGEATAVAVERI
jgi:acetyl-CoA C-acetyltransferase